MFEVGATSDRIWNYTDLINYLVKCQHKTANLVVTPEAICLKNLGLYQLLDQFEFKQVNIQTNNPLEQHHRYNIIFVKDYSWFNKFNVQDIDTTLHTWSKEKIFYCLFGRPTAGRLGLAGYLDSTYPSQTLIHFSATLDDNNLIQFELDKLLQYRYQSIRDVGNILSKLPTLLSSPDRYTAVNGYDYADPLTQYYQHILVDIVVESHVAGKTFYVTEKTVRPMLLKKPFVVFASKDYLDYLHQMGFKTFCNYWDENYDGFDGRDRFIKILKLIDSIVAKPIHELKSMYDDMQSVLEHNYNLLLSQQFNKDITEIV